MFGKSAKILVIDDEVDTTNLICLVLRRAGYKVSSATNWEEIISWLKRCEDTKETVDLVILDIMMPEKSGFDIMRILQVVLCPTPAVIFLTAKIGMDDMIKASELGAAKYMTKPTTPEKLLMAVREVLGKKK
jgi:DNA-binding response OmpR family regulator